MRFTQIGAFALATIIAYCAAPLQAGQKAFPTSRDPFKWPFSGTSIWNMPIHNNAKYVAGGMGAPTGWGMTEDVDIIILTPTAPLKPVYINGWAGDKRCSGTNKLGVPDLPIPKDFLVPAPGSGTPNYAAAILLQDKKTLVQIQSFHRCVVDGPAYSFVRYPDQDIYGAGIEGAHGGSGMSSIGGTVRMGELVKGGVINHALKINNYCKLYTAYNNDGTKGYRWPAKKADGYANSTTYGGKVPALEMGALLALKPEFDINGLKTEPGKIIAKALMNYGTYLVDDAAWDVVAIETERGPNGNVMTEFSSEWGHAYNTKDLSHPWSQDIATMVKALHVIDNNTATTIGGGSNTDFTNRRAPKAPPFVGTTGSISQPTRNVYQPENRTDIKAVRLIGIDGRVMAAGKTPPEAASRISASVVYLVEVDYGNGPTITRRCSLSSNGL